MRERAKRIGWAGAALAAVVAGCGGGDGATAVRLRLLLGAGVELDQLEIRAELGGTPLGPAQRAPRTPRPLDDGEELRLVFETRRALDDLDVEVAGLRAGAPVPGLLQRAHVERLVLGQTLELLVSFPGGGAPDGGAPDGGGGPDGSAGPDGGAEPDGGGGGDGGAGDGGSSPDAGSPPPALAIDEIFVAQQLEGSGRELVEIAGPPGTPLGAVRLRHVALDGHVVFDLPIGPGPIPADGVFAWGGALANSDDFTTDPSFDLSSAGGALQLLFDDGGAAPLLLDVVGYGGAVAAAPATAPTQTAEGSVVALPAAGRSLARPVDLAELGDNRADLCGQTPTPRAPNLAAASCD